MSHPCYSCTCTPTQPAADGVVWWTTLALNTVALCARHLEMWQRNADDDPELAPVEIRRVEVPA